MAMTMGFLQSQSKFMENLDYEDPEYIKEMMRPPQVKEDFRLMTQRRRVSLILKSAAFRKDLEKITASHMKDGTFTPQALALQNLADFLTPHAKLGSSAFTRCTTMPVLPINDLKPIAIDDMSKKERMLRCKLASVFRIIDLFGWSTTVNTHITAKIGSDGDEYLIDPSEILFNEITASSLMKVNLAGRVLDQGSLGLTLDYPGWLLHSAIYKSNATAKCIVHLSTPPAIVLSSHPRKILPLSQEAMILGEVAEYDFNPESNKSVDEECQAIIDALNSKSSNCRALVVKNLGMFVFGKTIEEAWMNAYTANLACEAQLKVTNIEMDELILPSREAQERAMVTGRTPSHIQMGSNTGSTPWTAGELEFEALMRRLDAAGYRTGHIYRLGQSLKQHRPDATQAPPTSTTELADNVAVPPTCSSFATSFYDTLDKTASVKSKSLSMQRHWASTPNAYKKKEQEEKGTANPQTIIKWTRDELDMSSLEEDEDYKSPVRAFSPIRKAHKRRTRARTLPRAATDEFPLTPAAAKAHTLTAGISIMTEDPNVYAPQGANPKELKFAQKMIRDRYYKGVRTPGPRSRLLMGLDDDYDMGYAHSDGELPSTVRPSSPLSATMKVFSGPVSPTGTLFRLDPNNPPQTEAGHAILIGAVSKGIIKPKMRQNVSLYQSLYRPNPFDNVTDDDLERYKTNVDRKQKGLPTLEEEEARRQLEERMAAEAKARQEALENSKKAGSSKKHLFSVPGRGRPKSDTSGADATEDTDKEDKKEKKKRRFKLPSFGLKSKKKGTEENP